MAVKKQARTKGMKMSAMHGIFAELDAMSETEKKEAARRLLNWMQDNGLV